VEILVLLIPLSVVLVFLIGAGFWWCVQSGQFDDLEGPAYRILADDDSAREGVEMDPGGREVGGEPAALTSINAGKEDAL
jgi:cbb3-type cytochrome oxidase maturation protein